MPATSTSTATSSARWWACSPSAANACPAPAPRPAARCTCTVCWARARRPAAGAGSGRAAAAAHRAARSHGRDQHLSGRAARRRIAWRPARPARARNGRWPGRPATMPGSPIRRPRRRCCPGWMPSSRGRRASWPMPTSTTLISRRCCSRGWRRAARAEPAHRPARRSDPGRARTDFGRAGRGRGLCAGAPARRAFRQRQHGRCRRQRQPDDDRLR